MHEIEPARGVRERGTSLLLDHEPPETSDGEPHDAHDRGEGQDIEEESAEPECEDDENEENRAHGYTNLRGALGGTSGRGLLLPWAPVGPEQGSHMSVREG
jgi:hypothetical protein